MSLYSFDNSLNLDKNDLEFLKKNKVLEMIQEGLISLCHSRPDEPFQYLIEFYSNQETKVINFNEIEKEILMMDYKAASFFMTLQNIYHKFLLCNNYKGLSKETGFVTGELMMDFVRHILKNVNESTALVKRISLKSYVHVTFNTFRYLIMVSLCFKDYLGISNQIYDIISDTKKSKSEYINFSVVLSRLAQWLDSYPQLDSLHESRIKNRDVFLLKQTNDSMTRNQFNIEAAKIFLEKVKNLNF